MCFFNCIITFRLKCVSRRVCFLGVVIPCFLSVGKIIYRKVYFYLVVNTESCTFDLSKRNK